MSIMVIGLTGQSGAGKTTVCKAFSDGGIPVINADAIARKVMEKGSDCLGDTVKMFGGILNDDGELNRKKLAEIVFTDKEKLKSYENIIFPYITEEIRGRIENAEKDGAVYILLDAPTLFESGADSMCDAVVSVIAEKNLRLKRILKRDAITRIEAENRINAQQDDGYYTEKSDYIITNNGTAEELEKQADAILNSIKERYNAKTR